MRVSLFMDPVPAAMVSVRDLGADRVELYTESYAGAATPQAQKDALSAFAQTALACHALKLGVNAGHDLNQHNLPEFLRQVPGIMEVSIGHALIADALELGYAAAVAAYLRCIDGTLPLASR